MSADAEVQASCLICGLVTLSPAQVHLVVCSMPRCPAQTRASWTCEACGSMRTHYLHENVARALLEIGVVGHPCAVPAELADPVRALARPIALDELLDLHEGLDGDAWVEELIVDRLKEITR